MRKPWATGGLLRHGKKIIFSLYLTITLTWQLKCLEQNEIFPKHNLDINKSLKLTKTEQHDYVGEGVFIYYPS